MTKQTKAWQQYHAEIALNWSVLPQALQRQVETIRSPARIDAAAVYCAIMKDIDLLCRCMALLRVTLPALEQ